MTRAVKTKTANLLVGQTRFAVVAEAGELSAAVVLVVNVVGDVLEVLKMCSHHHVAEGDEITMLEVLDWGKENEHT